MWWSFTSSSDARLYGLGAGRWCVSSRHIHAIHTSPSDSLPFKYNVKAIKWMFFFFCIFRKKSNRELYCVWTQSCWNNRNHEKIYDFCITGIRFVLGPNDSVIANWLYVWMINTIQLHLCESVGLGIKAWRAHTFQCSHIIGVYECVLFFLRSNCRCSVVVLAQFGLSCYYGCLMAKYCQPASPCASLPTYRFVVPRTLTH